MLLYGDFDSNHKFNIRNQEDAKKAGFPLVEVENAVDGTLWEKGFAPEQPEIEKKIRITELKTELNATDYKIIKCSEYSLNGQDLPYDIAELHAQRQEIRDEINALGG